MFKSLKVSSAICSAIFLFSSFVLAVPMKAVPYVENVIYGDVSGNGLVDSADFTYMRKYLLRITTSLPASNWQTAGDVNLDGIIDSADYTLLRRYLLTYIKSLPINITPAASPTSTPEPTATPTIKPTATPTPIDTNYVAYDELFSMTDSNINRSSSDHFQIIWGKSGNVTTDMVQGNLKNLENIRDFYIKELNIPDPGVSVNSAYAGTKRKTNLYIANTGLTNMNNGDWTAYMGADSKGMGYMVICPEGIRVDPPSTVTAHEFGHIINYHLKGWTDQTITGPWWESVATWFAERYMASDHYAYNGKNYSPETEYFAELNENLDRCSPNKDDYYKYWPFLNYLEENPDNLSGLGKGFLFKMITQAGKNEYPFDTVARLASPKTLKTILGNFAKRMATQELISPENYTTQKYQALLNVYKTDFKNQIANATSKAKVLTTLQSNSGWWTVASDRAPMQGGINLIPITASQYSIDMTGSKTITVTFEAMASQRTDGDFQVCLAAIDNAGKSTYSPLWSTGSGSIKIDSNTASLYLIVAATPNTMIPTSAFDEVANSQVRFPYRVKFTSN